MLFSNKEKLAFVLKEMDKPPLSEDWGEGEDIKIKGLDRDLLMKMDNMAGGPRWHPFKNYMIKLRKRS